MKKPHQRAARVGGLVVALERLSALAQPYGRALSLCLSALLSPPLKRAGAYLRHIRQYQRLHEVLRKPPYAVPLALCRCLDSGREQNLYGSYWRASACAFRFNGGPRLSEVSRFSSSALRSGSDGTLVGTLTHKAIRSAAYRDFVRPVLQLLKPAVPLSAALRRHSPPRVRAVA